MYTEPSAHRIDPASGAMTGQVGRYQKRFADLAGIYADSAAFADLVKTRGEEIAYTVHEVRPATSHGDLIFGTTFMEPGKVGDEFFLTRGHLHARANRPETYYGESGQGLMLLETPEGETRIVEVAPRVMVYVPPMWVHRSVNTGAEPLVMSFCYPADSGQDYGIIERSGGMASRIVADGTGWKAIPNKQYRRRSADQVAAVLASCDRGQDDL